MKANEILDQAVECIADRGARYNTGEERSMRCATEAFNAITGRSITEHDGWLLLALVKLVRAQGTPDDPDHYIDAAGYAALLGESRLRGAESVPGRDDPYGVRIQLCTEDSPSVARTPSEPSGRYYKGWDCQP